MVTTGSIVLDTCRAHHVTLEEFRDARARRDDIIACRIDVIKKMRAAGFSNGDIARMTGRHYDSIRYWTNPGFRARQIARVHRYWKMSRA